MKTNLKGENSMNKVDCAMEKNYKDIDSYRYSIREIESKLRNVDNLKHQLSVFKSVIETLERNKILLKILKIKEFNVDIVGGNYNSGEFAVKFTFNHSMKGEVTGFLRCKKHNRKPGYFIDSSGLNKETEDLLKGYVFITEDDESINSFELIKFYIENVL